MKKRKRLTMLRTEEGSIPVVVGVMVVSGLLVVALLDVAHFGLRMSRRAGDSANALQLADAAVNDAVKEVAKATGPTVTKTIDLGAAGSYDYTAQRDGAQDVWHVTATGIDKTGARRRIKADAVAESLFQNAFFVMATGQFSSGVSVDSFVDGSSLQNMCTRKGTVGTNDPPSLKFGNQGQGTGVRNCTQLARTMYWPYPVDGCIAYGNGTQPLPDTGVGKCPPPPDTRAVNEPWSPAQASRPGTPTPQPGGFCSNTNPIVGGQVYFWSSVDLRDGCYVNAKNGPAVIFTSGDINIGTASNKALINPPPPHPFSNVPDNAGQCPSNYANITDQWTNPAYFYCPRWSSTLQIYKVSGPVGNVNFRNHAQFWGIISAPNAAFFPGAGNPQVEMWGAFIANSVASGAQLTLHYDEALAMITTGRYTLKNWREEPINS